MAIIFKNAFAPVEIFFNKKIKNYHIRGKSFITYGIVFENPGDLGKYMGVYVLSYYALVNDKYLKDAARADPSDPSFLFALIGANKREYEKTISGIFRGIITDKIIAYDPDYLSKSGFNPEKLTAQQLLKYGNKPVTFPSLKIQDKEYIKAKMTENLPIIPAGVFLEPWYIKDVETQKPAKPFTLKPYHVFAGYFTQALKHSTRPLYQTFHSWLGYIYDQLSSVFGYPVISKNDFVNISKRIADLSYEWITTKTAFRPFLQKINAYLDTPDVESCYLSEFCDTVFFSLVDDMLETGAVSECQFCGLLFPFEKGKKYCSPKTDGRKCGKTARNKKYYKKNRIILLPKIKKDITETRKLYKTLRIKK